MLEIYEPMAIDLRTVAKADGFPWVLELLYAVAAGLLAAAFTLMVWAAVR